MMVQYGIWKFDEKLGLVGSPKELPELFIDVSKIWDVSVTSQGKVWKWPVEYARLGWFTPEIADDFNKTFFYAQNFLKGFNPVESFSDIAVDSRTLEIQTEILSDYFPGPEEELSVRT